MCARDEQPREDLLAEATALVRRVELRVAGGAEPVVIGFRRSGDGSIYFGQSLAYHFNARQELRRAFVEGLLYKAELGRLVALERCRTAHETALVRHELTPDEQVRFLHDCAARIHALRVAITCGECRPLRQVPAHEDVIAAVVAWLNDIDSSLVVARSARVG
jgi:hypothetical protein